ncbi:MAG: hypothetical protein JNK57_10420 [Planctomycetaceae bacterium]|nr:hypothetical protein [Planctomycetaceae bacterium]
MILTLSPTPLANRTANGRVRLLGRVSQLIWFQCVFLSLTCGLRAFAQNDQADDPIPTLRWKFQAGQVYQFDITQTSGTEEIDVAGNKTLQPESRHVQIQWTIVAATEELIDVEMYYREIEIELGTKSGKVAVSTRPDAPQIGAGKVSSLLKGLLQRLKPLIDQPIKVQVDRQGKVRRVELPAELVAHIQQKPETRSLRDAVSTKGIEQLLASFLTPLPSDPVATWEHRSTYEVAAGVPLTQRTRFQLGPWSEANPTVEVTYSSELSFPEQFLLGAREPNDPAASPAKDPNPPTGAAPPFDFDPVSQKWPRIDQQDCDGRLLFDINEGYVREASGRTVLVTEKAYSDTKIKITTSMQTEVKVQRLQP